MRNDARFLPLLGLAMVLGYMAVRTEALRPTVAVAVALVTPVVGPAAVVAPLRDAAPALRAAGFGLAFVAGAAALTLLAPPLLLGVPALPALGEPAVLAVGLGLLVPAALVEGWALREHYSLRLSAWIGLVFLWVGHLRGLLPASDPMGAVIASFVLALFVGGGVGLLAGAGGRRLFTTRRTAR